jgi:hypothetical protein
MTPSVPASPASTAVDTNESASPSAANNPAIIPELRTRKVFALRNFAPRAFDNEGRFLAENKLSLVDDPAEADIIIGKRLKDFKSGILNLDRLNVVWTKEPFHSFDTVTRVMVEGRDIYIFNLYNGNVYTDNYYDLPKGGAPLVENGKLNVPFENKRIVGVMTRKQKSAIVYGKERSLLTVREGIALEGHKAGGLDVYGADWPEGVAKAANRTQRHHKLLKQEILSGYNYNLCLENCCWDYYVTEKMWEAVFGHCLPIYYSNDTIMQLPFIDAAILINDRPTYPAIAEAIEKIKEREFVERLNTLIAAGNRALELGLGLKSNARTRRIFSSFLRTMA